MAPRRRGVRALRPALSSHGRQRWRVVCYGEDGQRHDRRFETEEAADSFWRAFNKRAGSRSVDGAIDDYEEWRADTNRKARSTATTVGRLRSFLGKHTADRVCDLSLSVLRRRYAQRVKGVAVATHRAELAEVKTFVRWLGARDLVPRVLVRDLDQIKGEGIRNRGKRQIERVDDVRALVARSLLVGGEAGAAVLCALLLGLRASEILERVGRDLDEGGSVLVVPEGKTINARRRVAVPEIMRPLLAELRLKAGPDGHLFPGRYGHGHKNRSWLLDRVRKLCGDAGVPVVSAHGLRGTSASMARGADLGPEAVAAYLGHGSATVTDRHYLADGVADDARQRAFLRVVDG